MHGTNPVAKTRKGTFLVHSIFYTIQGEGPFAGLPAIFVRLAGCNLRCFWCDTEFDALSQVAEGGVYLPEDLAANLKDKSIRTGCDLIVITGGEPMLQPIPQLIWAMEPFSDLRFQIETAGTVWPEGMEDCITGFADPTIDHSNHQEDITIVTSPKTPHVHALIAKYTDAWKYIVRDGECSSIDGLPMKKTQTRNSNRVGSTSDIYRPWKTPDEREYFDKQSIFIQPMDEPGIHQGRRNIEQAAKTVMDFGYRLSLQLHKIVGLD